MECFMFMLQTWASMLFFKQEFKINKKVNIMDWSSQNLNTSRKKNNRFKSFE